MVLRPDHSDPRDPADADASGKDHSRLTLLLSYGGWEDQTAVDQMPRLLAPLGIQSVRVYSGEEAADMLRRMPIHIAVVDLALPLSKRAAKADEAGPRLLRLLRGQDNPPPTVVVRPPQPSRRASVRGLSDALREGAFAVMDRPLNLEAMLEVMRRILRRHYADVWPTN